MFEVVEYGNVGGVVLDGCIVCEWDDDDSCCE